MSAGHGRSCAATHGDATALSVDVAHAVARAMVLYAPEAHSAHALAPAAEAYWPMGQSMQPAPLATPTPDEYAPAVHAAAHALAVAAYLPGTHARHADAPVAEAIVPAVQADAQAVAPSAVL
jgi:hypothetical protein